MNAESDWQYQNGTSRTTSRSSHRVVISAQQGSDENFNNEAYPRDDCLRDSYPMPQNTPPLQGHPPITPPTMAPPTTPPTMAPPKQNTGSVSSDRMRTEPMDEQNIRQKFTREFTRADDDRYLIKEHDSYHGEMTGEEAEQMLRTRKETSYLTLWSKNKQSNVLLVMVRNIHGQFEYFHFKLIVDNKEEIYQIENHRSFPSIHDLLSHYERSTVTSKVKNTGKMLPSPEAEERLLKEENYQREQQIQREQDERRQLEDRLREADRQKNDLQEQNRGQQELLRQQTENINRLIERLANPPPPQPPEPPPPPANPPPPPEPEVRVDPPQPARPQRQQQPSKKCPIL